MLANTLFSGSLLNIPVLVTLGIYVGFNWQHINTTIIKGQVPANWSPNSGGGANSSVSTGKLKIETYCQKAIGIVPFPGRYILNPNIWGDEENSGQLCMNVTIDPKIKKTERYAPTFNVTWGFPQRTNTQPVHAFPNAMLNMAKPVQVSSIAALPLDVEWSYAMGNVAAESGMVQQTELAAASLNANVAVDMFLSDVKDDSLSATKATHEVMVWLARWGTDSPPVGTPVVPAVTQTVNGATFVLYYGENGNKQKVFTWFSDKTYAFKGDLAPFLKQLSTLPNGPAASSYLGYYAFGSEAFWVNGGNVTFGVQKLDLDITTS